MKKTLYVIKNLGVWKSTIYLILYPLRFLRRALTKLDDLHDEIRWHEKISTYLKQTGLNRKNVKSKHTHYEAEKFFKGYGFKINTDWMHFYGELSGIKSKYYIPEDFYFRQIEPHFINNRLQRFYSDKNMYDLLFDGVIQPESILRYFDGKYYSSKYDMLTLREASEKLNKISSSWLIKPSVESGKGRNIKEGKSQSGILTVDGAKISLGELTKAYRSGFIIQEKITSQNKTLADFHPASLNTIRVMTLRLNNVIHAINRHAKFGTKNRIVDNNGGIWCGVDTSGLIHSTGINSSFQKIDDHPDTGMKFKGTKIENFKKIIDFSVRLHKMVLRTDLVSWDIGLSANNEPILIECNTRFQGISYHQALNGPLFGDLTDDVLAEVVKRREQNLS